MELKQQYVLLQFALEKDVPNLAQLVSQVGWSIDGVRYCEHVDIGRLEFEVVGQAPDTLYARPVEEKDKQIVMSIWMDGSRFAKALSVGWKCKVLAFVLWALRV